MALGADCVDDCDVLRSGHTRAVLGHGVSAPSTLGTFLRAFTFGHVRQLDRTRGAGRRRPAVGEASDARIELERISHGEAEGPIDLLFRVIKT
jgi:hypothetical protein